MPRPENSQEHNIGKDKITPEEKLLRIIENPASEAARYRHFALQKKPAPDFMALIAKIRGFRLDKSSLKKLSFPVANKIVAAAGVIFTIFLISSFIRDKIHYRKSFEALISAASLESAEDKDLPIIDVAETDLLKEAKQRNIFSFLPPKAEAAVIAEAPKVITDFKLVGILWSESPQAMIEDIKDQKTYFLKRGEKIQEITVKTIFRDKVVLNRDEQEWELR